MLIQLLGSFYLQNQAEFAQRSGWNSGVFPKESGFPGCFTSAIQHSQLLQPMNTSQLSAEQNRDFGGHHCPELGDTELVPLGQEEGNPQPSLPPELHPQPLAGQGDTQCPSRGVVAFGVTAWT